MWYSQEAVLDEARGAAATSRGSDEEATRRW